MELTQRILNSLKGCLYITVTTQAQVTDCESMDSQITQSSLAGPTCLRR